EGPGLRPLATGPPDEVFALAADTFREAGRSRPAGLGAGFPLPPEVGRGLELLRAAIRLHSYFQLEKSRRLPSKQYLLDDRVRPNLQHVGL
ncbi:MAG: hypothetical protein RL628_1786, partial [Actinomycetota bacterium]